MNGHCTSHLSTLVYMDMHSKRRLSFDFEFDFTLSSHYSGCSIELAQ